MLVFLLLSKPKCQLFCRGVTQTLQLPNRCSPILLEFTVQNPRFKKMCLLKLRTPFPTMVRRQRSPRHPWWCLQEGCEGKNLLHSLNSRAYFNDIMSLNTETLFKDRMMCLIPFLKLAKSMKISTSWGLIGIYTKNYFAWDT